MRLELGTFPVEEIRFGALTRWENRVLELRRQELLDLVRQDPHIMQADIQIASRGESVRIINIKDALEPRVKVQGPGTVYPAMCGRPATLVGQGRTHRLAGCTVIECLDMTGMTKDEWYWPIRPQAGSPDPFADMSGPGAVTPYASTHNVCLVVQPSADLSPEDRGVVAFNAALRLSDRLAETTRELEPPEVEVFDLTPKPGLPGFVFVPHLASNEWFVGPRSRQGMAVYGQTRLSAPWLLHGTELLDGAVAGGNFWGHTWSMVNNPVVLQMCRYHGQRFNFLGVIVHRTNWTLQEEKALMSDLVAQLASMLGAQGAIITTDVRGQRYMETVMTVQSCERAGIKTILLTEEEDNEDGTAPPLIVSAPEVVAVVSVGTGGVPSTFPPVKQMIGSLNGPDRRWFQEQLPIPGRYGAFHIKDYYGWGKQGCLDF